MIVALIVSQTSSFVFSQSKGHGRLADHNNLLWSQTEGTAQDTTVSSGAIHDNATQIIRRRSKLSKRRRSDKWEQMVAQLTRYNKLHGHSMVSPDENPELAQWCKTIRRNYRHQQLNGTAEQLIGSSRPTLSNEKLKVLSQLNFVWNVQTYLWNQRYHDLCSFRAQNGHCDVPLKSDLGMWVHNQKCSYRSLLQGKPSNLTPERLAALTSIGFWDDFQTHVDSWNQRYQELQEFHETYGHSNVPEDYTENYRLGQWVMNQRLSYKKFVAGLPTPLTPERIASLEALHFRWNLHSYNWFAMCQRLGQYAQEHGHVHIATSDESNRDLKLWLVQQRHAYQRRLQGRPTSMTERRQAALESIPHLEWKNTTKSNGPKLEDWDELFAGIREKGIVPGMRPKQHWFEGDNRFKEEVKDIYTDEDLLDLWNQEDDEE